MTHFSLKSTALAASFLALSVSISAFAAPVNTECSTDPLFAANACNECYVDAHTPIKTSTGWTAELSDVVIPWEHSGIELQEVISENAQKLPEMISSADVKVIPDEADKIWEFDTDIVWYVVGSDREYFIEKGDNIGLYTLKTGVKLALSGTGTKDTVLMKTPLIYEEYNKDLNQSASGKLRNICVLNTFYTGTTPPPPAVVSPPAVITNTLEEDVVVPALDAAGPEEEEIPEITPEQTETKAGPGMWIFLLLALVFSSAYTAWRKQKI